MFIVDWFYGLMGWLRLYRKSATILFLGLDNAGKTTLLHMLKADHLATHIPTQHPTMEELQLGNLSCSTWDLGGHKQARKVWKEYYAGADAIVFLCDAAARDRFDESKKELDGLLSIDELQNVPFLILGNKVDIGSAASEEELKEALGVRHTTGKGKVSLEPNIRPIEVFMCSIKNRMGYGDGFIWLAQYVG